MHGQSKITQKLARNGRAKQLPSTLALQVYTEGQWHNLNVLSVSPYTLEGAEAVQEKLRHQMDRWWSNYDLFRSSSFQIVPYSGR